MATDIGQLRSAGIVIESAFGTATQLTDRIPFTSESLTSDWENNLVAYLNGTVGQQESDITQKKWSGSIEGPMVYDKLDTTYFGIDTLIAAAMGANAFDDPYIEMTLADELPKSITLAIEKQVSVWCFLGCYVRTLEIKGSANDGIWTYSAELQPYNMDKDNATTTNSGALPAGITKEIVYRMLYANTDFMLAPVSSGTLSTSNKVAVTEFSFKLDNGLSDPEYATEDTSHTDGFLPIQPVRNGPRIVTLDLTIPRYSADTWENYLTGQTPLNLWIKNASAADEEYHIKIPYAKVVKTDASGSGGDVIRPKYSLVCYRGASYNDGAGNTTLLLEDGATTISEEFTVETKNERTAAIWT